MKRIMMAGLMLFTFACAPHIQGLRSSEPVAQSPAAPEIPQALKDLLNSLDEPKPALKLECKEPLLSCVLHYRLSDEISSESTDKAIEWINAANEAGATDIVFEMNSGGGSVNAGFELARVIEESRAPVSMVVDWEAASMAAFLLESAQHRYITRRGMLMFHEPALSGTMSGRPNEWQAIADMMKAMRHAIAQHCSARMNVDISYYEKRTEGGQMWWLTADEAKEFGAVDQVVDSVAQVIRALKQGSN